MKKSWIIFILLLILVFSSLALIYFNFSSIKFSLALKLLENGDKDKAYSLISSLQSKTDIQEKRYQKAIQFNKDGDIETAILLFEGLDNYKHCASQVNMLKKNGRKGIQNKEDFDYLNLVEVGDSIYLGEYEQDNDLENGKEPIEWLVLSKRNSKLLLISKFGLDVQQYNNKLKDVIWRDSSLHTWMYSDFYQQSFSNEEKMFIEYSYLGRYKGYDNDSNEISYDYISLLSDGELSEYFKSDENAICQPTEYAKANGAYISEFKGTEGNGWWWLRTEGNVGQTTKAVRESGEVYSGIYVDKDFLMIRPAMWVVFE